MASTAFVDVTGGEGTVYIFDKGTNALRESIGFSLGEDRAFRLSGLPGDMAESLLSLPLSMLNFRVLELPLMDMDKIKDILPFELEGIILGGSENIVFDARVLESGEAGHKVLAVYMEKGVLKGLLDGLKPFGIDPKAVTSLDLGSALEAYAGSSGELGSLLLEHRVAPGDQRIERALREMSQCTMNLRTGEFSYTREVEQTRRTLRFAAVALIALVLIFAGDIALRTMASKKEGARLEKAVLKKYSEVFPGEAPKAATGLTYKLKSQIKELEQKVAFTTGVSPLDFLLELQGRNVPGLVFTDITLSGEAVVLKGEASSLSDVEAVKGRLEGLLKDVTISETGQSARGKTVFTITAKGVKA
jgi:type II secretory pathway component PulL